MTNRPTRKPRTKGFLGTQALTASRAMATFSSRGLLRAVFFAAVVGAAAMETIRFDLVQPTRSAATSARTVDPVVASVGDEVLRLSDAYAHAGFVGAGQAGDVTDLVASGLVREAADHLALAEAARDAGFANSLDIRAAVALAERQILAEAYLEQVATEAVTEDAIEARYAEKQAALASENVMRLSQIVVPTKEAAESIAARLPRGDFAALARQRSIDEPTKKLGGSLGEVEAADLHPALAEAASALAVGGVSQPVETEAGWHVLKLESRRALRLPPLETLRDAITAELRQEAIAEAMQTARAMSPTRLRDPQVVAMEQTEIAGSIAVTRSQ